MKRYDFNLSVPTGTVQFTTNQPMTTSQQRQQQQRQQQRWQWQQQQQ